MKILKKNLAFFDVLYSEKEFKKFMEKLGLMIFERRSIFSKIEKMNKLNFNYIRYTLKDEDIILRFHFSIYVDLTSEDKDKIIKKIERGDLQFKIPRESIFSIISNEKNMKKIEKNIMHKNSNNSTVKLSKSDTLYNIYNTYKIYEEINLKIKIDRKKEKVSIEDGKYSNSRNIYQNGINPVYSTQYINLISHNTVIYDNDCDSGPLIRGKIFCSTRDVKLREMAKEIIGDK